MVKMNLMMSATSTRNFLIIGILYNFWYLTSTISEGVMSVGEASGLGIGIILLICLILLVMILLYRYQRKKKKVDVAVSHNGNGIDSGWI